MKKTLTYSFLIGCLLGASTFVVGQDVNTQPNDEAYTGSSRKSMRVVAFRGESGTESDAEPESLFYENKGKKARLYTAEGSLSTSMPMPTGEVMNIYQEVQLPIKDSTKTKTGYRNVGAVSMVSGSKAILILIIPADLTKDKIRGRAFKDSVAIHKKGTARVFNMSKKVVAIRAGKEALKVPVGASGIIQWKAVAFNSVAYQIGTAGEKAGTWDIIQSSECAAPPEMRTFVFVSGTMIEDRQTVTSSTFLDPIPDKDARGSGDTP